jgi:hypothetical protein
MDGVTFLGQSMLPCLSRNAIVLKEQSTCLCLTGCTHVANALGVRVLRSAYA